MSEPKNTGRFGKGNPGKPKGATTKVTREVKEMILEALDGAGGIEYLIKQAHSKPAAFLALVGKVMPLQVTGAGGGPIAFERIVREVIDPAK
jgi:hypothetical protein